MDRDFDYRPVRAQVIAYRGGRTYQRVPEAAVRAIVAAGAGGASSMATILGLAKLQTKLNRLPATAKVQIKAAMEKGAGEIVTMMKSLVETPLAALSLGNPTSYEVRSQTHRYFADDRW